MCSVCLCAYKSKNCNRVHIYKMSFQGFKPKEIFSAELVFGNTSHYTHWQPFSNPDPLSKHYFYDTIFRICCILVIEQKFKPSIDDEESKIFIAKLQAILTSSYYCAPEVLWVQWDQLTFTLNN